VGVNVYVGVYQKFLVVLENKIWRFMDSAGTKNLYLTGTNDFIPLFSNNRVVQMNCLFFSCLSDLLSRLGIHSSKCVFFFCAQCVAVCCSVLQCVAVCCSRVPTSQTQHLVCFVFGCKIVRGCKCVFLSCAQCATVVVSCTVLQPGTHIATIAFDLLCMWVLKCIWV